MFQIVSVSFRNRPYRYVNRECHATSFATFETISWSIEMILGFRGQNNDMKKIPSYKGVPKVETGNGSISGLIFRDWKPVLSWLLWEHLHNVELSISVSVIHSCQSCLSIKACSQYPAIAAHSMSFLEIFILLKNIWLPPSALYISVTTRNQRVRTSITRECIVASLKTKFHAL